MKSFLVRNVKTFMAGLLSGNLFADWQFRGAELSVECKISVAPLAEHAYLPDHECDYLLWPEIQEKFYALIRGKQTPGYLHLALAYPKEQVPEAARDFIDAFTLNIQYEKGTLVLITAESDRSFCPDKEPGRIWDAFLPALLSQKGIDLEEIRD